MLRATVFLELRDHAEALGEHVGDNQFLEWELSCRFDQGKVVNDVKAQ
jgi:hypothetical protein